MVALIFGIISIVCCVLSWLGISWLSFIGLICGIVAWAVGASAVKANPADGQAKAGKIMGIVTTIIAIVSVVIAIILIITTIAAVGSLGAFL
jgi:hypothetical protein